MNKPIDITIHKAILADLELLMHWRMIVLHEVFAIPAINSLPELEQANRKYYQAALAAGNHIACFAKLANNVVGCGGMCLYQEMPSPDNPSGHCAYLMNIYTCPEQRKQGIGKKIAGWLVQQAKQLSITKIYLETSASGRRLYQEMGFSDMQGYLQYQAKE